jgi:hypothetical protein
MIEVRTFGYVDGSECGQEMRVEMVDAGVGWVWHGNHCGWGHEPAPQSVRPASRLPRFDPESREGMYCPHGIRVSHGCHWIEPYPCDGEDCSPESFKGSLKEALGIDEDDPSWPDVWGMPELPS